MKETLAIPRSARVKPAIFNEYFGLGQDESASPFLTPKARRWAVNLTLKASLFAAGLLILAFALSFHPDLLSLSFMLLVSTYFFAGIPSLIESLQDLANFDVNIDVLMTLAAFSSIFIGSSMEGALLLVLFSLSGSISDAVTSKAKGSLNNLNLLSPPKATLIDAEGRLIDKAIQDIPLNSLILIRAGEIVPLDGLVIDGISSVNLVHLTGESLPVTKKIGDEVPAGARNLDGALTLRTTRTSSDSTLTKIIQLVTQAQEAKPQLQRWFDTLSRGYALTIIALSFLFVLAIPLFLNIPFTGFEGSIYRGVAFLIAASPCALIIALPIAYLSAISACARKGILLKGGVILDSLAQCATIAFDKTGTLTTGEMTCLGIQPLPPLTDPWNESEILAIAYALEKNAVHPIARAIIDCASKRELPPVSVSNFKSIPGYGIEASVSYQGETVHAFMGHPDYIRNQLSGKEQELLQNTINAEYDQGLSIAVLRLGTALFAFTFQDTLRPALQETMERLKQAGHWKLLMLTGDHSKSAKRIADTLGIDDYYANLRPEDKLDHVTRLAQKEGLAMVGDGINDAPALARATVGICMGKVGSGSAIDAADVVLLQDNLERLDWLMRKGRQTQTIVRQNLAIAASAILIASIPALAGWVPLWLAVVLHEGGTVLVGLNALRLLR